MRFLGNLLGFLVLACLAGAGVLFTAVFTTIWAAALFPDQNPWTHILFGVCLGCGAATLILAFGINLYYVSNPPKG